MNPRISFTFAFVAGILIALSGCAVGPDYHPPKITPPNKWSEPMRGGETSNVQPVAAWWKTFHDPELNSLIQRAVMSNHDLRVAEARVREARAQYSGAFAQLWPTLDGGGAYQRVGRSHNNPSLGAPIPGLGALALPSKPFQNDVYLYGFDSAWEIDVFGGTRRQVEASKAELAAAELGKRDVVVSLLGEVARNYVETRGLQNRLEIAHNNIKSQEEGLALTQARFKSGLTSELDVQQATALLANTRSLVPVIETGIQQSIHRLGVLLGQEPGSLQAELCKPSPLLAKAPKVPVGLPADLLRRRPDIQRAERELAAANARIGVATADLFPKFSLTGGIGGISVSDWYSSGSRFWNFGPTVQWRIFDAGRIRANIRVQNARQEQALALYEKSVLTAMEDVENALVAYAKEQERHRCLKQAVEANRDALHLASQNYANGLANFINVLDAERSLHQAEDSLAQSDTAVLQNLVVLYKALGGGWDSL
jgi:NodT family efflux transporter outer membrane factor (OMF) lipoprotein